MIVVAAPAMGDILQAQKPPKPKKDIHGEGFKQIFDEAMERINDSNRRWRDKDVMR